MSKYEESVDISELLGKTLVSVTKESEHDDALVFTVENGQVYRMHHSQNCCEDVFIESIVGDLQDLVNSPILLAEKAIQEAIVPPAGKYEDEDMQWTFYKLATKKGYVDIRWFGGSNGYYGVDVDFLRMPNDI